MARSWTFLLCTATADYVQYPGKTAYYGHGGDEIDSDGSAPSGLDVDQCEARCDADAQCACVSFRPADGKCWKRGNCVPSLFGVDGNFDTYLKSSATGEYMRYPGKTAYYGHGGDEIDSDSSAPSGLDVDQCEARCDADAQCACVSFRLADGKCWKRGNCVPSLFGADGNFDTYVKSSGPGPAPSPGVEVDATTLHWNAHRPCATDQASCIGAAQSRLGEMAREVSAQIVGAVELKDAVVALPGWQSTGMQCDNSAVMVAPGWGIIKSGGYCMNGDAAKGFAVALVTPPQQVAGCQSLCVMMGHVPHEGVSSGGSKIAEVCGDARTTCMIGMGDWNSEEISAQWGALVGGATVLVEPHEKTCCYNKFIYAFDHTATNIAGAYSAGKTVYPPQLTRFPSYNEHMPTSVMLRLPGVSASVQSELVV